MLIKIDGKLIFSGRLNMEAKQLLYIQGSLHPNTEQN